MPRRRQAVVSPKGAVAEEGEDVRAPSGRADNIRPTAAFVERYVLIVIFPARRFGAGSRFQLRHSECRMHLLFFVS